MPAMAAVREVADELEGVVPDRLWPLPEVLGDPVRQVARRAPGDGHGSPAGGGALRRSGMTGLRSARRGVALVFFVYGGVLATWVSRIPLIKQELGLDTAQLSVALLGSPVGLILATQLVSAAVRRWTSAAVTRWALLAACAAMVLPSLAWSLGSLAAALFLLGASLGALDIAMNTQGVAIERGYGRPIMSGHPRHVQRRRAGRRRGRCARRPRGRRPDGALPRRRRLSSRRWGRRPRARCWARRPTRRRRREGAGRRRRRRCGCSRSIPADRAGRDRLLLPVRRGRGRRLERRLPARGAGRLAGRGAAGRRRVRDRDGARALRRRRRDRAPRAAGDAVACVADRRRGHEPRRARAVAGRGHRRLRRARARRGHDRADRLHARRHQGAACRPRGASPA